VENVKPKLYFRFAPILAPPEDGLIPPKDGGSPLCCDFDIWLLFARGQKKHSLYN